MIASGGDIGTTMKTWLGAGLITLCAGPALAFQCTFHTECLDADACQSTSFAIGLDNEGMLSTDYANLWVLEDQFLDEARVIFAKSDGMAYLLTITGQDVRMATHMTGMGMSVTYLGTCEQ